MAKQNNNYSFIDLIKYPIITDKSTRIISKNQYTFSVDPKMSKPQIKEAIEFLFEVKVQKINTCHLPVKTRRVGKFSGKKPHYKKAIIKLSEGYNINFFSDDYK
jgi:large subunit ribosomal protein L23